MANTKLDVRQVETKVLQDQLNANPVTGMDSTLASVNSELQVPGRMIAATVPSLIVTVGAGTVSNPNTAKKRVLPFISGTPLDFPGGSITFPPTSGAIVVSPGSGGSITIGSNQFVAVTVQLDATSQMVISIGTAAPSLASVVIPGGNLTDLTIGYIIVQSNGAGQIQNVTNSMIYQTDMPSVAIGATFDPDTILTGTQSMPIQTDWVAYIPTVPSGGTFSSSAMRWRRVGDSIELQGNIAITAATASELRFSLPFGILSDSVKIVGFTNCGGWGLLSSAGYGANTNGNQITLIQPGIGYINLGYNLGSTRPSAITPLTGSTLGATTYYITAKFPVSGWTANNDFGSVLVNNDGNVLIA